MNMEVDPLQSETDALKQKSEALVALSNSAITSSISKISGSSRVLPSEKDFHFYYNFDEFKGPIDEIGAKSQSMLEQINSAKQLWGGKEMEFPQDVDDEAYDWLVNVNDEVIEKFDVSVDEFSRLRKVEEEAARARHLVDEDGFQLVCGKKKKGLGIGGMREKEEIVPSPSVRVVERDKKTEGPKQKVPFHISTIRRPQEEYNILVNNTNTPFQHVWLEKSEDDSKFIHPLEKLSVNDFVDCNIESLEPVMPPPLESTPFKMVEEVKDLKELAAKLRSANEIAVDLEHNQYRSFQGLTCLMQISTRTEDFVVDTLKLRIHIGPYLREIFKDPTKKKVMHGADRDIAWLQRDFGIYVCNLFDTGQASRVLQMERHSLEHLLQHFCGVTANKQYQNADWRLRPLPREMLRYAREDTHYLLYIYDLMRIRLLSESTDPENLKGLLLEVYQRSYDLCMQLYEKELLTDTSYLYIYGVQAANLNAQQLSIVAGLCDWRDAIARAEDESTGYILPNKVLLEIAKQMPLTTSKLRHLVKSKHPYVERNLGSVVNIIRHAVQNASSFEAVAQQLKEARIQMAPELNNAGTDISEAQTGSIGEGSDGSQHEQAPAHLQLKDPGLKLTVHDPKPRKDGVLVKDNLQNGNITKGTNGSVTLESQREQVAETTVQLLKKPGRAFGALLGSSASKKKTDFKKGEDKLEQIKSTVNLPFYSFSSREQELKPATKEPPEEPNRTSDAQLSGESSYEPKLGSISEDVILLDGDQRSMQACEEPDRASEVLPSVSHPVQSGSNTMLDDVILLDSDTSDEEPADSLDRDQNHADSNDHQVACQPEIVVLDEDDDEDNEPISLTDLSSSFEKCLQPMNQSHASKQEKDPEDTGGLQFKPFDYEAARKEVKFGEPAKRDLKTNDNNNHSGKKKGVITDRSSNDEDLLPQGKRRQAFPASGNRSVTFR
ncbi:protein RRP6-like 2 isoform X2 [Chenopodium quinoa]|uniref:protein RRP6-like 2 isoform X2 n=1 Tax=Chenopodium quinoa TaxID=63459 RepID=UPI000B78FB21|nr:protein RRP6-like 2 isoform X2 [Chenopodium quinoa]